MLVLLVVSLFVFSCSSTIRYSSSTNKRYSYKNPPQQKEPTSLDLPILDSLDVSSKGFLNPNYLFIA
jgi:hypothetical protein